jgi:glycine dehydrogenase
MSNTFSSELNFHQAMRENARHYIPASEEELYSMLEAIGKSKLADLFDSIPKADQFKAPLPLPAELDANQTMAHLKALASSNAISVSYLGDGLADFAISPIVSKVAALRTLSTTYTPYQAEMSQGTLICHWIYQCAMSKLTGFEAVNASLYDRSTAIYEGICAAARMSRRNTAIVAESLYPGDLEVLQTHAADTDLKLLLAPVSADSGLLDADALRNLVQQAASDLAAIVFPQVNTFGLLETVDEWTDLAAECGAHAIAVIDPLLLANGGLKPPVEFGKDGASIIVGEAQHLALEPNFGGPGLGLFGMRFNESAKNTVRAAPGRFIGKALDRNGRECRVSVLSTREQHIRRDKATSNICSNQAFLATLVGAALLERGDEGMEKAIRISRERASSFAQRLATVKGCRLAFPQADCFNEITLQTDLPVADLLAAARSQGILLGADLSGRAGVQRNLLKLSFSDRPEQDVQQLLTVLRGICGDMQTDGSVAVGLPLADGHKRKGSVGLKSFGLDSVYSYYQQLAALNVSPDRAIYPLGSCTMKYNPFLNEWAAALPEFTRIHPQAPAEDSQGCLSVLHEIQEWFKGITGLAGVTTQPVAGAQGELVGLKMIRAYHRQRGDIDRNVILIPRSAHGTNFATAVTAGFRPGPNSGIVLLEADADGLIDEQDLAQKLELHGKYVAGVMITNPNTTGIFESRFSAISKRIHAVGGLVYMDGANMNAIAGWANLAALGVDAVHNNLHKTWTIPHGGGGPGDAIVAVSERLVDFLPGYQIEKRDDRLVAIKMPHSIGSFHRHWGNFAHKLRCYTYLLRLGRDGVRRMSAVAVLAARYLLHKLQPHYTVLPATSTQTPRMHEFILTFSEDEFKFLESNGYPRASVIPSLGKLFLDFGYHAPTVAWPEALGFMIEPTESYTRAELDRFADAVIAIKELVMQFPRVLASAPHFTPIDRVDEISANRNPVLAETLHQLPPICASRLSQDHLLEMPIDSIVEQILQAAGIVEEPLEVLV